jgi:hypothetical protein
MTSVTRRLFFIVGYSAREKRLALLSLARAALFIFASESLSLLDCSLLGAANEFAAR